MDDFSKYKKIAGLIVKELSDGLSPKETEALNKWLEESQDNKALYLRVRNSENYRSRNMSYEGVDIPAGWNKVSFRLLKNRKTFMIMKYAAILILSMALASGVFYYFLDRPVIPVETSRLADIKPGKTKATLTLTNGQSVILGSGKEMNITEEDGTLIRKNSNGLNYTNAQETETRQPLHNILSTPRGGEYHLTLSDGTRVYLNAMSQLKYPVRFTGHVREVELEGEAYFEVAKNRGKPFKVKTQKLNIVVLGTSFNINTYDFPGQVVTTLVEGTVTLDPDNQSSEEQILKPNEQALFDLKNEKIEIKKVDVSRYTAWKEGQFIFYDQRLADIMSILSKWYSANVSFADPSVENLHFSGSLDRYGDINQILEVIRETNKVNIKIEGKNILLSPK